MQRLGRTFRLFFIHRWQQLPALGRYCPNPKPGTEQYSWAKAAQEE